MSRPALPRALLALLLLSALPAEAPAAPPPGRPTFLDVLSDAPGKRPPGTGAAVAEGLELIAENDRVVLRFSGFKAGGAVPYDPKVRAFVPAEYRLYRSRNRDMGYLLLKTLPVSKSGNYEFVDGEAKNGETFWYAIRAADADRRETELHGKIAATPADTIRPKRVPAPALELRDNAILIRWEPSEDPDFALYRLYRAEGVNGEYLPVAEIGERGQTTYVDPKVRHEGGYIYAVTVVDRSGNESVPSNDRMAIARDLSAPAPPASLAAVPMDRAALLRFPSVHDADLEFYRVHSGTGTLSRTTKFDVIARIAKRDLAYVEEKVANLVNGKPVHFYVTAVDAAGNESAPTQIVTAVPVDRTAPDTPGRLEALPMNGALKIEFDETEDLDGDLLAYRVYRRSAAFPQWILHKVITPATKRRRTVRDGRPLGIFEPAPVSFVDKGLVNGMRYAYRVTAVDRSGNESTPAETIDCVPEDRMPPAKIASLKAVSGIARVTVSFAKLSDRDLAGYLIRRRAADAPDTPFVSVADLPAEPAKSGRVSWIDRDVVPGEKYEYEVAARDESGNLSEPSPPASCSPRHDNRLSVSKAYVKNVPLAFVFSLDPNLKSFYFTKTQNYKDYGKWDGPHELPGWPPNFTHRSQVSFQKLEGGVGVFCYSPETLDLYFTSTPDMKNWGAWQLLCDELPLPPGWGEETVVAFEHYPDRIEGLSFTPLPPESHRCFTKDGEEWRKWRPVAGKLAPPVHYSPDNRWSVSSDDRGVTLYGFRRADNALYVSFCFDGREFRDWYRFEEKSLKLPNRVPDAAAE